jgi:trehalose 6-phosphate synthase
MNLVAKEYVSAQDPEDPGVLILSHFAGAAQELESALLVNPHDRDAVAEALQQAMHMPLPERRDRWETMMTVLRDNDVSAWRQTFLEALGPKLRKAA